MKLTNDFKTNVKLLQNELYVGKTFDVLERIIDVHNTKFYCYYLDGFVKDTNMEYVRRDMYNLKKEDFESISSAKELIEKALSSIEASTDNDLASIVKAVLSGQTAIICEKFNEALILDYRTYPSRSVDEPDKEKVLRGSHDGFVETIVFNTALIRRRIRDPKLIFEMHTIGEISQTDVAIGYLDSKVDKKTLNKVKDLIDNLKIKALTLGDESLLEVLEISQTDVAIGYLDSKVDKKTLNKVKDLIDNLKIKALTLGDESLLEVLMPKNRLNPFPKARYTERPDVVAAEIIEGKIVILIDNTPSALILPASIFDFFQSIDDYYLPVVTGNYLKMLRYFVLLANIFLTPVYVLLTDNPII